jgi:hypothetical protein
LIRGWWTVDGARWRPSRARVASLSFLPITVH